MRLANRGSKSTKTYETQTGPSGYSQEGISALRSEIQGGQKSMQMGSQEYMVEANRLVDLTSFENLLKTAVQNGIELDPALLETNFEKIDLGVDVSDEEWQVLVDTINAKLADLGLDPIELDVKTGGVKAVKDDVGGLEKNVMGAIGAFGQLGGVMQQIEDPAAKVAGLIMGAVAEVAASFASSLKGTMTPWDWIAAAIAGTATMISTIAAIKSATGGGGGSTSGNYASGGKIPGNSFSGDNMRGILPNGDLVGLDAGEIILNRAQQGVVAGAMQGNPMSNMRLSTEISGTNLRIVMNNDNRSKGGDRNFYSKIH